MILVGTRANAERRRRAVPVLETTFYRSEWIEYGDDPTLSPTVILVEQPPNTTLVAHFHQTNQFQLFVEGSGRIGRHPVRPFLVHYAGAYTGYGPLVSGAGGLKYFTFRPMCDSGFIAASDRERMIRGPKRHAQSEQFQIGARPGEPPIVEPESQSLIPLASDGLGATLTRLPANAPFIVIPAPASQGQFLIVLNGTLHYGETELGKWESLFVLDDEPRLQLRAGLSGAEVVAMHTPHKDAAYL